MDNLGEFGPVNGDVLNMQNKHRSGLISDRVKYDSKLKTRHAGGIFWSVRPNLDPEGQDGNGRLKQSSRLHWRVVQRLEVMGFYGVYRCGVHKVNAALITALVERWRSETHTFHFTIGEATVTLQDVSYLYALPIEGRPVVNRVVETRVDILRALCDQLLGWSPNNSDFRAGALHMVNLGLQLMGREITDETPAFQVDQYARGVVLILFGSILCPNTSGRFGSLAYLPQLADIEACKGYSWGAAVLSYLYNQLCMASECTRENIAGPMMLLQIWAWSRITFVQPTQGRDRLQMGQIPLPTGDILPAPPMAADYLRTQDYDTVLNHGLRTIRAAFDNQIDREFIWDPYTISDSASLQAYLNDHIIGPSNTWLSECPLIHYNIVELYHPSRVLRQFGYRQSIPPAIPPHHQSLHIYSGRAGTKCEDWLQTHHHQIDAWQRRHEHVHVGHEILPGESDVDADYMRWYNRITRRVNTPAMSVPAGVQPQRKSLVEKLVKHIRRIHMLVLESPTMASTEKAHFEDIYEEAQDAIREARVVIGDEETEHVVSPIASPPRRRGSSRQRSASSTLRLGPPRFGESTSSSSHPDQREHSVHMSLDLELYNRDETDIVPLSRRNAD